MKTLNTNTTSSVFSSTFSSLQEEFNAIIANQEWYGLSLGEKISLLCNAGNEYKEVRQASLVAVTNHRKTHKQRSLAKVRVRRVRTKVARATKVVLFEGIKTPQNILSAGITLLRVLGRKISQTLSVIESEVMNLNVRELELLSAWETNRGGNRITDAFKGFKAAIAA